MPLFVPPHVREALLLEHKVTEAQIEQCFAGRPPVGHDQTEPRIENAAAGWFIAETDYGIRLKVRFLFDTATKIVEIKSAAPPCEEDERAYALLVEKRGP